MSDNKERRFDDDDSEMGGESPPPVPPFRAQPSFDIANGIYVSQSVCRAKYMIDGSHGKKICVCSKNVIVCKQHLHKRKKGRSGIL